MEIGVLPEQENKETDDVSFLEGIWDKVNNPIVKAINLNDHIDYTDPLGWETLGQRWGEKTIGKQWREGQMQDVWNAVPESWRPNITKAAMATAESVGTAWGGARTVDNWFNPLDVAAAGTARTIELAALPFEALAQLTSAGTGLDIELSRVVVDFVPVGGIINRTKLLRRANIAKKSISKSSFSPGSLDDLLEKAVKSGNKKEMKRVLDLMETQDAGFIRENEILTSIKNKIDPPIEDTIRRGSKGEVVQNPALEIYKREDAAWISQGLQSAVPAKPTAATKWDKKMDDIYKLFTGQDPDLPTAGAKELQKIKLHRAKGSKDPKFIKHHPAPLAHIARSLDYLTNDGVRAGADYLSRKIGTTLGDFQPGTLAEEMFHSKMHRFLDDRLGSSKGGLLYKLEKKYFGKRTLKDGISLQERIDTGFMDELADVIVEQKDLIDDWYRALVNRAEFKKVSLEEYVNEAAETIKLNKVLKEIASGKRTKGLGADDLIDRVIGLENKELRDTMKDLLQYKEIDDLLLSDEARHLKNLNLYKAKEQFLLELMNMDWAGGKLDAAQQVFKLIDEYDLPFTRTDQNMIDDLVDALERVPIEESLDPKVAKEIKEWLGRD